MHRAEMKMHKPFHEDMIEGQGEIRIFLGGKTKRGIDTTQNQSRGFPGFHTSRPMFLVSPTKRSQHILSSGGQRSSDEDSKRPSPATRLPRLDSFASTTKKPLHSSATTGIFTPRGVQKPNTSKRGGLTRASQEFALGEFSM